MSFLWGYPSDWSQVPSQGGTLVSGREYPSPGGYLSPRGTPVPGRRYPSPRWGVPPWSGQDGVPPGQVRMGYPQDRMGYLTARSRWATPGKDRMGHPPPPARSGWGTPWSGQDGVPIGQDGVPSPPPPRTGYAWTGYATDGTPLAVPSRRTVLLITK